MFDTGIFDIRPIANPKAIVKGDKYRFTVLTSQLIRMEWSEDGTFEDRATQKFFCRDLPVPEFTVTETDNSLEIETERLHLYYDKKEFSAGGLSILIKGLVKHKCYKWFYGMPQPRLFNQTTNRRGTVRTLDMADGEIDLPHGLLDRHGFTTVDDSNAMVMGEDGWIYPAERAGAIDLYFFGYLEDNKECIRDFYKISGATPMIPRYALGNWWSRYYKYTEETYLDLMNKFKEKNVPLAVSVLDIDWHPVLDVDPKYGNGWTGYTWNKKFFPDPKRFLDKLHSMNLGVTLNLHPCDGIRGLEDCYKDVAVAMGVDPTTEKPIEFDASDKKFMDTYLKKVLNPLEDEGVDFWWIDWQQLGGAKDLRYDPLWVLNHYLYADGARKNKYPLILSRYAGLGSHRYPLGFSGDTLMSWESLDFQPYFTNCASNVGYGWWSHDIGGHKKAEWSDDMQVRWTQYGVFSPIYRPHSGKDTFYLKEPWNFPIGAELILEDFMRLRHKLVPYLYTANYENHADGIPLVRPLYYLFPETQYRYDFRNQYYFGSELMVAPITEATDVYSGTGRVRTYIPKGDYFDFFTGRHYKGQRILMVHRTIDKIPVFAKGGAIVPLANDGCVNGTPLPVNLKLKVFAGADNKYNLYEDNEKLRDNKSAVTPYSFKWGKTAVFTKGAVIGDLKEMPQERNYTFNFVGFNKPEKVTANINGKSCDLSFEYCAKCGTVTVSVSGIKNSDIMEITVVTNGEIAQNDFRAECEERLARYQMDNNVKGNILELITMSEDRLSFVGALSSTGAPEYVIGELTEIATSGY